MNRVWLEWPDCDAQQENCSEKGHSPKRSRAMREQRQEGFLIGSSEEAMRP